ncbi:TPA: 3-mercaptopropionate dioxygenase, partial [Pseudomonas aeruginosa]|nr:3-mercaptopropionate dioxygenase [Pseudomonas aeruginosa]
MSSILRLDRLRQFIGELATLLDSRPDESTLLTQAHPLLAELVRQDDWLPEDC